MGSMDSDNIFKKKYYKYKAKYIDLRTQLSLIGGAMREHDANLAAPAAPAQLLEALDLARAVPPAPEAPAIAPAAGAIAWDPAIVPPILPRPRLIRHGEPHPRQRAHPQDNLRIGLLRRRHVMNQIPNETQDVYILPYEDKIKRIVSTWPIKKSLDKDAYFNEYKDRGDDLNIIYQNFKNLPIDFDL